jgi:site-specific DNA-methyltransferase (adenine-specific)
MYPLAVGEKDVKGNMDAQPINSIQRKHTPTSTVGRGRAVRQIAATDVDVTAWSDNLISVQLGDSLEHYQQWETPTVIVSDGGYGVLGFEGDTSDHLGLPHWYEPHIAAWSKHATPFTTLWFWNSEIGWAAVHPVLEKHGWRYVNANIWNKGKGHIAGNVNTAKIRRFPVVSEVCVQYVYEARVNGLPLKTWLLREWKRSGLPVRKANEACAVADAATRKYLDQGHLWYYPPPEMFLKMQEYANKHGDRAGRPYFSIDGKQPGTAEQWAAMRSKFDCPHGFTNVWDRNALQGSERFKINGTSGKAIHLNQKPLDLTTMIIRASSDKGDVVWEPFGGLFTACLAARNSGRRAFGAEIDPTYFHYAVKRLIQESRQSLFFGYSSALPELGK